MTCVKTATLLLFLALPGLLVTGCDRTRPYMPPGAAADPTVATPAPSSGPSVAAQPPTVTPRGCRFTYADPGAQSVHVAGSFNEWSTSANPMVRGDDGIWVAVIELASGRYPYKFVVNGSDWKTDPVNPVKEDDGYGGSNSIAEVP